MIVIVVLERWEDHDDRGWDDRGHGRPTDGIPPEVLARLHDRSLGEALRPLLAGTPADGSIGGAAAQSSAVWVDGGDEVVVHVDSLAIHVLDGAVVASLDLECDQTGRAPVVVRFAISGPAGEAGLIAATDEVAGGDPVLAARWGVRVQDAVWSVLLRLVQEHAAAHGESPVGLSAASGALRLHLGAPLNLTPPPTPVHRP